MIFLPVCSETIWFICEEQTFVNLTCKEKDVLYIFKETFDPVQRTDLKDLFSESNWFGSWIQLNDLMNQAQEFHWRIFNKWVKFWPVYYTEQLYGFRRYEI